MAREVNATFVNILSMLENAQDNITEANLKADEAKDATEDAAHLLKQIIELVKLRRSQDGDGELANYIDNIKSAVEDIEHNIGQIKKGQQHGNAS